MTAPNPSPSSTSAFHQPDAARRIWAKDPTFWKADPSLAPLIKNRLGWLTIVPAMQAQVRELLDFAEESKRSGCTHVVLLGMGGSSLAPEVFAHTFGSAPGYPTLHVLDSTDPATIRAVEHAVDLSNTLFICSSKSGTTIETSSLYQYFAERLRTTHGKQGKPLGAQFIAITDPGTPLERLARDVQFRRIFLAPPDVGGRFSALTVFGLVPAALIGVDLRALLQRAQQMGTACAASVSREQNPGISLGILLGGRAKAGRDKLTFVISPVIERFGTWLEQLIAESTGKEGQGIVPVEGEALGQPVAYSDDRVFVAIKVHGNQTSHPGETSIEATLKRLEGDGHPVIRLTLNDRLELGGEFFRWELATAVAGAMLGINPFDEPNVTESKDNTKRLLEQFHATGALQEGSPVFHQDGFQVFGDVPAVPSLSTVLAHHLSQSRHGDYIALMAYFQQTPEHHRALHAIRQTLRDTFKVATTVGYGPRFLHSTGQLHKGGPDHGLFLQLTAEDQEDLPIPGQPYTFGVLKRAQAVGDFLALKAHGRRVIRIHIGRRQADGTGKITLAAALQRLLSAFEEVATELASR